MPKISIVLPTYNERDNIGALIERTLATLKDHPLEIVVVDDDSPDLTWQVVAEKVAADPRVKLVHRTTESGLTSAIWRGITEASGDWVEACELRLALAGEPERRLRFGRMDSLPLPLGRLLSVIDDLYLEVDRLAPRSTLPAGYEPRAGDRLRRFDGTLYEVVAPTGDGRGLELEGVDEPLILFIPLDALRDEFEELVSRRQ